MYELTCIKALQIGDVFWLEGETYQMEPRTLRAFREGNKNFLKHFEPANQAAQALYEETK